NEYGFRESRRSGFPCRRTEQTAPFAASQPILIGARHYCAIELDYLTEDRELGHVRWAQAEVERARCQSAANENRTGEGDEGVAPRRADLPQASGRGGAAGQ